MRFAAFVPSRWRLPECIRKILPLAVTLKRFLAPRCVFSFFFGFSELRGIARILSVTAGRSGLKFPMELRVLLRRRGAAPYRRTCALLGGQERDQNVPFHAWRRFDLAVVGNFAQ